MSTSTALIIGLTTLKFATSLFNASAIMLSAVGANSSTKKLTSAVTIRTKSIVLLITCTKLSILKNGIQKFFPKILKSYFLNTNNKIALKLSKSFRELSHT